MIIKVEGLNEAIAKFSSLEIASALNAGIKKSVYKIQASAIRESPTDTSFLKNAWRVRFDNLSGQLVNTAKYAPFVHFWRRPWWKLPPFDERSSLAKWINRQGISAPPFLIARSIAKKGTKANPFLKRALDQEKWKIPQIISHEMYMLLNK